MTTGYVIRCAGCSEEAPLAGELLSDLSAQVMAFQQQHTYAECQCLVDYVIVSAGKPVATAAA